MPAPTAHPSLRGHRPLPRAGPRYSPPAQGGGGGGATSWSFPASSSRRRTDPPDEPPFPGARSGGGDWDPPAPLEAPWTPRSPGERPGSPLADPWAVEPPPPPGELGSAGEPWSPTAAPAPVVPQLSPAYSSPGSPAYTPPLRGSAPPALVDTSEPPARKRRWLVPLLALLLAAAVAAGAFVVLAGGDGDGGYVFGTVATATGDARVRTGEGGGARPLEEGESVEAGWVVEAPTDSAVTLELAGGGIVRFDSGAILSFVDLAQRGENEDEPTPAIEVDGGRAWLNPVNVPASAAVALEIPEATVVTTGNPVAVDCTSTCGVEAPAGGVTLTTDADLDASPGPNEIVTVQSADALEVATGSGLSAWAGQNTNADSEDGLPEPEAVENNTGVKGTAVADGTYNLTLAVTGDPAGDPIPDDLKFFPQQTFTVDLVADGSSCVTVPCDVNVTANDGATGTARIENGSVVREFHPADQLLRRDLHHRRRAQHRDHRRAGHAPDHRDRAGRRPVGRHRARRRGDRGRQPHGAVQRGRDVGHRDERHDARRCACPVTLPGASDR